MKKVYPIVLFVYNRIEHTEKTIQSLLKNPLSINSELFVFSDGPKNNEDIKLVKTLRSYLSKIEGFKSVKIIESKINQGLGTSLISGITKVLKKNKAVIILEDDIVVNHNFLSFMNYSLNFYLDKKDVFHISGYIYPINTKNINEDYFFLKNTTCWGWGTWADRWRFFKKDIEYFKKFLNEEKLKKEFNLNNSYNFYDQIILNDKKEINSWAVFWYASVFKNNGLCLHPKYSFTQNIGTDNSGTNTIQSKYFFVKNLNQSKIFHLPEKIKISEPALSELIIYFKNLKIKRFINHLNNQGFLNTFIKTIKYLKRNW